MTDKITFYANPYSTDLTGFYFASPEEYEEKLAVAQATDPSGDFEHEIELIDFDDPLVPVLVEYLGGKVNPRDLERFYETIASAEPMLGAHLAFINSVGGHSDFDGIDEAVQYAKDGYRGEESSVKDYAMYAVDEELISTPSNYFDYEGFGRDIRMDFDEEDEERYEGMSDYDIGQDFVDNMGGVNELGPVTVGRYIDYDNLARDLEIEGYQEVDFDGSTYIYQYH